MNNLIISNKAIIGKHCTIHAFTQICDDVVILNDTTIGHNVFIGNKVKIGSNCKIQGNVFIPEGITIKDNVFIGPSTVFCNVKNPDTITKRAYQQTLICSYAVIGANCTILPGIAIGYSSVLGAGSVLTKNLSHNVIAYGNPAKEVLNLISE